MLEHRLGCRFDHGAGGQSQGARIVSWSGIERLRCMLQRRASSVQVCRDGAQMRQAMRIVASRQ